MKKQGYRLQELHLVTNVKQSPQDKGDIYI